MEDIKDISIQVDADTSTVAANGLQPENLYKVCREGIGLRIVPVPTSTVSGNTISSFEWRYINPLAPPSTGIVYKFTSVLSIVEYRTGITFLGTAEEGAVYVLTFLGTTVTYVVQPGDTLTDIRDNIKTLVDATTYSYPTTTSTATLTGNPTLYIDALTGFVPPCTIYVRSVGYYLSKSGLITVLGGAYYIVSMETNAGYEIPAIPVLDPTYDYDDFILPPYGLEAYLADGMYPTEDVYTIAVEGTADIDNVASTSYSLGPNEVCLDYLNDVYAFGTVFISGIPNTVSIIYK